MANLLPLAERARLSGLQNTILQTDFLNDILSDMCEDKESAQILLRAAEEEKLEAEKKEAKLEAEKKEAKLEAEKKEAQALLRAAEAKQEAIGQEKDRVLHLVPPNHDRRTEVELWLAHLPINNATLDMLRMFTRAETVFQELNPSQGLLSYLRHNHLLLLIFCLFVLFVLLLKQTNNYG